MKRRNVLKVMLIGAATTVLLFGGMSLLLDMFTKGISNDEMYKRIESLGPGVIREMAVALKTDNVPYSIARIDYSETLIRLDPLTVEVTTDGIYLVFRERFVEIHGVFIPFDASASPGGSERKIFEKKFDGIFFYHDLG